MNISTKLKRVKQQADHLFLRSDRCDVVGELRDAEEQAEELRVLCEAYSRGVEKCLHTHQAPEEKKYRKVPEYQMAEILKEALKEGAKDQTVSGPIHETMQTNLLRCVVECVTEVEQALGMEVIDYEEKVKMDVLEPLQNIIKEDISSINKQKKTLKQVGLDVDAARGKYRSAQAKPGQNPQIDQIREELEEAESKLDTARDSYAYDIFSLLSREREVAQHVCGYLELQQQYLQMALAKVNNVLPEMKKQFETSTACPVYGKPLDEHLSVTHQKIAVPLGICVRRLIEVGMHEEGLFRVAGSASKVKRLKGAFDANLVTDEALALIDEHDREYDVHVVAGALKCYLRELPEPLLTLFLHDQWVEAVRKQDHQERLRAIWCVVNQLPEPNLDNVKYLFKFLQMLSTNSQVNKMTPSNISIVIAPNLIWAQREKDEQPDMSTMGRNMSLSSDYRSLVDNLVEYCDYFFKDDNIEFGVTPRPSIPSSPSLSQHTSSNDALPVNTQQSNKLNVPNTHHKRTSSADFNSGSPKIIPRAYDRRNTNPDLSEVTLRKGGVALRNISEVSRFSDQRFGTIECESPKQPARSKRGKKQAPRPPQVGGTGPYNNFSNLPSTPLHNSQENIMSSSSSPEQMLRSNTPPKSDHSRSHTPPKDQQNTSQATVGREGVDRPTAATRLHHSGSIKRPREEPPKPPGGIGGGSPVTTGSTTTKPPPRPSPPHQVHERLGTPPTEALSSNSESNSRTASQPVPLGFEQIQSSTEVNHNHDNHLDSIQLRREPPPGSKENIANVNGGSPQQIGFVLDQNDESEENKENSPSNTNFRKSLANVIQQQAAAPPLALPRLQSSSSDTSGGDPVEADNSSPRAVSVLPPVPVQRTVVPATRTTANKENAENQESSSRADKPAVPEKPSIMQRSIGFVEQPKPQIRERPVLVSHRNTVSPQLLSQMTSSFTDGEHESRSKGISGDSNLMTKSCENGLSISRNNSSCGNNISNNEVNNSSSNSNNNSEDLNCNSNKRSSCPIWPPQATVTMATVTEPKSEDLLDSTNL